MSVGLSLFVYGVTTLQRTSVLMIERGFASVLVRLDTFKEKGEELQRKLQKEEVRSRRLLRISFPLDVVPLCDF